MSVVVNSYLKSLLVAVVVVIASIGAAYVINPSTVFIPQHQFEFELTDAIEDVNVSYIDIVEYGSYRLGKKVVLYLEVQGLINASAVYQLFIVAKTPGDDVAHTYNNEVDDGTEDFYQSTVTINDNRLEVLFSTDRFISNSYMIGIEVSALVFATEDTTPSARNNSLLTRFLGIF